MFKEDSEELMKYKVFYVMCVILTGIFIYSVVSNPAVSTPDQDGYKTIFTGRIYAFDFPQSDPDILFAASPSVNKSVNGGQTWTRIRSLPSIQTIAIKEENPNTVFAAPGG